MRDARRCQDLDDDIRRSEQSKTRFIRTMTVWRRLTNPNICHLYGACYTIPGGGPMAAMELCASGTQRSLLEDHASAWAELALLILSQEAGAMHTKGFVHGDLRYHTILATDGERSWRAKCRASPRTSARLEQICGRPCRARNPMAASRARALSSAANASTRSFRSETKLSGEMWELVKLACRCDPEERPSMNEAHGLVKASWSAHREAAAWLPFMIKLSIILCTFRTFNSICCAKKAGKCGWSISIQKQDVKHRRPFLHFVKNNNISCGFFETTAITNDASFWLQPPRASPKRRRQSATQRNAIALHLSISRGLCPHPHTRTSASHSPRLPSHRRHHHERQWWWEFALGPPRELRGRALVFLCVAGLDAAAEPARQRGQHDLHVQQQ